MSHIHDALRKAGGDEPDRGRGHPARGEPSREPPAAEASAASPPAGLEPRGQIDGQLFGAPQQAFLEELETVRANLEVGLGSGARRVVGFAGAARGEGATTLALHFAYLMAHVAQRRVLLVDGDMARSNVALSSAVEDRHGLTELLRGGAEPDAAVLATEHARLHFLPAGRDRVHYVEAITSGALRPLFDRLGALYDWVVVDLPPLLRHPEAALIGAASDGVVLVVRAHRIRRTVAQRALAELNQSRCRVLGTVLNARKESLPSFLRERV